jgi:hypothetical protein
MSLTLLVQIVVGFGAAVIGGLFTIAATRRVTQDTVKGNLEAARKDREEVLKADGEAKLRRAVFEIEFNKNTLKVPRSAYAWIPLENAALRESMAVVRDQDWMMAIQRANSLITHYNTLVKYSNERVRPGEGTLDSQLQSYQAPLEETLQRASDALMKTWGYEMGSKP